MVPKIIHYCWFGGGEKPSSVKKCIDSWSQKCPGYEIKEWNETNYDISKSSYTLQAYEAKKYAFLTDYVRLDVLYREGGVYFDTDVKLIKSIETLVEKGPFMAFEKKGRVNTGIGFACEPNNPIVYENKSYYDNHNFINQDGEFDPEICVKITTKILIDHGLDYESDVKQTIKGLTVYPSSYFSPKILGTNKINISESTFGIHLFESSWYEGNKFSKKFKYYLIPLKEFIKYRILHRKLYE